MVVNIVLKFQSPLQVIMVLRKRMERKGKKGSEEDDYFNKFPPTMPSVVLENRLIHYPSPFFFLFSTYLPPCSPLLTTSLPSSSPSYSLPLSREEEGGREVVRMTERKEGDR
jgi:hypothetical protein